MKYDVPFSNEILIKFHRLLSFAFFVVNLQCEILIFSASRKKSQKLLYLNGMMFYLTGLAQFLKLFGNGTFIPYTIEYIIV